MAIRTIHLRSLIIVNDKPLSLNDASYGNIYIVPQFEMRLMDKGDKVMIDDNKSREIITLMPEKTKEQLSLEIKQAQKTIELERQRPIIMELQKLRDKFAMAALTSIDSLQIIWGDILSKAPYRMDKIDKETREIKEVAELAYKIADAMIEERAKNK